jgi:hypothetical protein
MLDSRYSVLVIKGMCSSNDTRPSARQPRGLHVLRATAKPSAFLLAQLLYI